jgi:hypothetical protein
MKRSHRILLAVDGTVDLLLGLALIIAPSGITKFLQLPDAGAYLYTTVLGGVLVGIGLALLLSLKSSAGLGLAGALVINICGASAAAGWLVFSAGELSPVGEVVLWSAIGAVFVVALAELVARPWRSGG